MNEEFDALFFNQPLYGIAATVLLYVAALLLRSKWPWLHPLFMTCTFLMVLVLATDTYDSYQIGGEWVTFFLGPATVALGVPLYKHFRTIKRHFKAIVVGVVVGSLSSLAAVWGLLFVLDSSKEMMLSMLPKSVTAPVSVGIAKQLGGIPELAAVFAVLTGLFGSIMGPALLKCIGIKHDVAIGTAIGTSSHGIGTARVIRDSDLQGSISSVAMGLTAIITSILVVPLYYLW